ncbi:MAG: PD-(D/E)XK nuclease family protein, partial [Muribaculaceae bacterium]|nr:PD-(D/E)XK nuclease family protein [Muribaculaceae bacterium]
MPQHIPPFLKCVAHAYLAQRDVCLSDCCFIFPNRRSGLFFRKYIGDSLNGKSALLPHITTITDWVSYMSRDVEANRIDQLFILYRAYRNIAKQRDMFVSPFSKFIFWGDIIINDFNDIDKSLANAKQVFSNIKNYNEIQTSFLTEEQQVAIEDFFGIKLDSHVKNDEYGNPIEQFWLHIGNDDIDTKGKFLKLWSVLYPLYKEYNTLLAADGKSYLGAMHRKVSDMLSDIDTNQLEWKRYIFVGFNMLNESERCIFRTLQKKGIADFYWDCNSPIMNQDNIGATHFIVRNKQTFPSLYPDFEKENTAVPNITFVSIPSNTGMAKVATQILNDLPDSNLIPSRANAINTAIILPDESLFMPVYSSIHKSFDKVNITLGTPLRMFAVTTLLTSIISLHKRTWDKDGVHHFFHEDVKNLLSNPYIASFEPDSILGFIDRLARSKQKMVPITDLQKINSTLEPIFKQISDTDSGSDVLDYLENVYRIVTELVLKLNDKHFDNNTTTLDNGILGRIQQILTQLRHILSIYNDINLQGNTFLLLIQRLINSSTIALEGEPLQGLQVMGILETRNLDFDNIIILSANEKTYPRKMFTRSMIPQNMRIGYNLPTNQHEESVNTYYFYRLLSRAENVYMIYDTRTQIRSGGEESRYIYQLRYLYDKFLHFKNRSYVMKVLNPQPSHIEIKKTDRIMRLLNRYRDNQNDSADKKYFSATALKKYLICPLQFYLHYVEGLYPEETKDIEFIDSATFGSVLHDTMKELYYGESEARNINRTLSAEEIKSFIDSTKLEKILIKQINHLHYNIRDMKKAAEKAP